MTSTNKRVYVSPTIFYAFIDRVNPKHNQASAYFRYFAQNNYALFVNILDVTEVYNDLCKRMSPSVGKEFLRILFLSDINIIYPEETDIKLALKTMLNYGNDQLKYPEALRATVAQKRGIQSVATFEFLHSLFGIDNFFLPI